MPNMNDNKLLTLQEAAAILRKHPRTLTRGMTPAYCD